MDVEIMAQRGIDRLLEAFFDRAAPAPELAARRQMTLTRGTDRRINACD
jgi:hypothetical protein